MAQLNTNEILIFGGLDTKNLDPTTHSFIAKVHIDSGELSVTRGTPLPQRVLPENPGYNLNSHANFYFLGNIASIFRYSKHDGLWSEVVYK